MNWRNIYIQNPYTSQSGSKERSQRYTPTRKQKTTNIQNQLTLQCLRDKSNSRTYQLSEQKQTSTHKNSSNKSRSHDHNSSKKQHRLKIQAKVHGKKYVVTQQWVIKLKRELDKLMQCIQSLVFMNKNNMHRVDKFIKSQSMKIREEITKKMGEIINQLGLTSKNSPIKLMDKNIGNGYIRVKTQAVDRILKKQEQTKKEGSKQPFTIKPVPAGNSSPSTMLLKPTVLKQTSILTQNQSSSQSPQSNQYKKQVKDSKPSIDKKMTIETISTTPSPNLLINSKQRKSPPQRNHNQSPTNLKPTQYKTTNPESSPKPQPQPQPKPKQTPPQKQRYTRSKLSTTQPNPSSFKPTEQTQSSNKVPEIKQTVKNINSCINNMSKMLQNLQ